MTRAVIKMRQDINMILPKLNKVLNGCAYDAISHTLGFRVEDFSVVIKDREILIIGAETEKQAWEVLDWLASRAKTDEAETTNETNYQYHNRLVISK